MLKFSFMDTGQPLIGGSTKQQQNPGLFVVHADTVRKPEVKRQSVQYWKKKCAARTAHSNMESKN